MALGLGPHERLSTLVAKQPDLYDPYRWMCIGNSSTSSPTPFPTQFVVLLHSWVGNIKLMYFGGIALLRVELLRGFSSVQKILNLVRLWHDV